jgi:uncharacterized protein YjiS (DUF1127 family)
MKLRPFVRVSLIGIPQRIQDSSEMPFRGDAIMNTSKLPAVTLGKAPASAGLLARFRNSIQKLLASHRQRQVLLSTSQDLLDDMGIDRPDDRRVEDSLSVDSPKVLSQSYLYRNTL